MRITVEASPSRPALYKVEATTAELIAWLRAQDRLPAAFDLHWVPNGLKMTIKRAFDSKADQLRYADSQEKIDLLDRLENEGVVRQECPVSNDYRTVAYWPYSVVKPERLPEKLKPEYEKLGEIRW